MCAIFYVGPWVYYSGQILIAIITIAITDCKVDSHLHAATGPNMATLTYTYKEKILSYNHQEYAGVCTVYHSLWLMQTWATV